MDQQPLDRSQRPFGRYSNLVLGRVDNQGVFFQVDKPSLITVLNTGPHPKYPGIRLMILCNNDVHVVRSEAHPAPPEALQMLQELETRIAFSKSLRK